jgi:hypothetical protein
MHSTDVTQHGIKMDGVLCHLNHVSYTKAKCLGIQQISHIKFY